MKFIMMQYVKCVWRFFREPFIMRALRRRYPECLFYNGVVVDPASHLTKYNVLFEGVKLSNITLGEHTYIQKNSSISNCDVGKFCSIAADVTIGLGQHPTNFVSTHPAFFSNTQPIARTFSDAEKCATSLRVTIGNDVWIGNGAIVLDGVSIGDGAIVAAGAVVTKNIPPYSIVAGVPAQVIKYRFEKDMCEKIHHISWWNKSDEWLEEHGSLFTSPELLMKAVEKYDD